MKEYKKPTFDVIEFELNDIICVSDINPQHEDVDINPDDHGGGGIGGGTGGLFTPRYTYKF